MPRMRYVTLTYSHGEYDDNTRTWVTEGGYTEVKCKHCTEKREINPPSHSCYTIEREFVASHKCTKLTKCEKCGEAITKKALKKHQGSLSCNAERTANELEAQNKSKLNWWLANDLESYFQDRSEMLIYGRRLNCHRGSRMKNDSLDISPLSHREIAQIKNTATDLIAYIKDIVQYEEHFTNYCRPGWGGKARVEKCAWISKEYKQLLDLFGGRWDEDTIYHVIRYHENPHEREAIICLLEMRKEAEV